MKSIVIKVGQVAFAGRDGSPDIYLIPSNNYNYKKHFFPDTASFTTHA
jgi:hypothetical protein